MRAPDGGSGSVGRRVRRAAWCVGLSALVAACGGPEGSDAGTVGDTTRAAAGQPTTDAGEPAAGAPAGEDRPMQEVNRFLSYRAADSLVDLKLWAGYGGANSAWNFDGYYGGNATVVVPLGWRVEATYQTLDANVPHSAAIVDTVAEIPNDGSGVQLAFRGASTPSFTTGISSTREPLTFDFTADEAGRYWIFCGVPGHAQQGMWIWFEVSATAEAPDFRTEEGG